MFQIVQGFLDTILSTDVLKVKCNFLRVVNIVVSVGGIRGL